MPSTNEATAAIINMINVRSCQASQRNLYKKTKKVDIHQEVWPLQTEETNICLCN